MNPSPPLTRLEQLSTQLTAQGWAVLDRQALVGLTGIRLGQLKAWEPFWLDLPVDNHLRDGGRYRRRRHGCFVVEGQTCKAAPHRPHWQPLEYNALHGGIQRQFEALPDQLVADPAWACLLVTLAQQASALRGPQRWFVEAHPFRIEAIDGIGRPTPEGAHRDGVDLVAVVFVGRHNVKGGETRVFDARGPQGVRFTLDEPWSMLLLDDERVIHESTPIQPMDAAQPSWRDTLVLTFRSQGFQGPPED
jgi:hypothetical protein